MESPEFRERLDAIFLELSLGKESRSSQGVRLVQYCGVEMRGALDVPESEIEHQIEGLVAEGFCLKWINENGITYLKVWEPDGPEPDWSSVFKEDNLTDVQQILRDAGFKDL